MWPLLLMPLRRLGAAWMSMVTRTAGSWRSVTLTSQTEIGVVRGVACYYPTGHRTAHARRSAPPRSAIEAFMSWMATAPKCGNSSTRRWTNADGS